MRNVSRRRQLERPLGAPTQGPDSTHRSVHQQRHAGPAARSRRPAAARWPRRNPEQKPVREPGAHPTFTAMVPSRSNTARSTRAVSSPVFIRTASSRSRSVIRPSAICRGSRVPSRTSSRLSPETSLSNQSQRTHAMATARCRTTRQSPAHIVGQKGDAPTTARLSTEPSRTAVQASNARCWPNERLPAALSMQSVKTKTLAARELICSMVKSVPLPNTV